MSDKTPQSLADKIQRLKEIKAPTKAIIKKTTNSEKTQTKKDRPWLFQPGQSGNPAGPKPGYHHAKTYALKIIKELAKTKDGKDMELGEAMVRAQVQIALKGDTRGFNAIFDRVDGKPMQPIGGEEDAPPLKIDLTHILRKAYGQE